MSTQSTMASLSSPDAPDNGGKRKADTYALVESMTFASGVIRECDCDECGGMLPAPIANAVRQHKRFKMPLRRTQDRSLVARAGGISVWKFVMPVDAEPLVEYGNSHRIMFVDRLPTNSVIKSIGTGGIIGSSNEELSRKALDWTEGTGCLIHENGGRALGWIHTGSAAAKESVKQVGHSILFAMKITPEALEDSSLEDLDHKDWRRVVQALFVKLLSESRDGVTNGNTKLDEGDCKTVKGVIHQLQEKMTT